MMMVLSAKLTRRPSAPGSSRRLFLLVLVAGLAVATVLSMMFAGDAEAKKKPKKKKKAPPPTSIQAPIPPTPVSQASSLQAPGATFQKLPTNVYQGESGAQAWGDNITGQLGDGTTADRNTPVEVSNLSGVHQ
jgi:hypothetical protein